MSNSTPQSAAPSGWVDVTNNCNGESVVSLWRHLPLLLGSTAQWVCENYLIGCTNSALKWQLANRRQLSSPWADLFEWACGNCGWVCCAVATWEVMKRPLSMSLANNYVGMLLCLYSGLACGYLIVESTGIRNNVKFVVCRAACTLPFSAFFKLNATTHSLGSHLVSWNYEVVAAPRHFEAPEDELFKDRFDKREGGARVTLNVLKMAGTCRMVCFRGTFLARLHK